MAKKSAGFESWTRSADERGYDHPTSIHVLIKYDYQYGKHDYGKHAAASRSTAESKSAYENSRETMHWGL
jgi:hypothetical protein